MSNVRRLKMRSAQPSASLVSRFHRMHAWSAPKELRQFSQRVGPSLALTGQASGSRKVSPVSRLRAVFCTSPPRVCFSGRTFPRQPCRLGAPGVSRRCGALVGAPSNKPSVKPPRVRYSALRHLAARFSACQPPNPSIERTNNGGSSFTAFAYAQPPLFASHLKR